MSKLASRINVQSRNNAENTSPTRLQRYGFVDAPDKTPAIVHDVLRSNGQPLGSGTLADMESRFGHDFSRVRIHTNSSAAKSAHGVGALAFTVGKHVVFGQGNYQPSSSNGKRLLAHELTHVVQQANYHDAAHGAIEIDSSNGRAEAEAESVSQQVTSLSSSQQSGPWSPVIEKSNSILQRYEAREHALAGDATSAALSRVMGFLSEAEGELRRGRSAWRELALARNLWERKGGDPEALRLLERATNENDEANYEQALSFLEQATPLVLNWLREHPEATDQSTTTIAGREHPEIEGLLALDREAAPRTLTLRESGVEVTYGEIIAMGDLYPTPEAMHRAPREELIKSDGSGVLDVIRAEVSGRKDLNFNLAYQKATEQREEQQYDRVGNEIGLRGADVGGMSYASLAKLNEDHFTGESKPAWQNRHEEALSIAKTSRNDRDRKSRAEGTNKAYTINAFGDHFLTDAFAAGHLLYKASFMRRAGDFWNNNKEQALDAFAEALLNDHPAAVRRLVRQELPIGLGHIPVLGFLLAWLVTTFAKGTVKEKIKDKIRDFDKDPKTQDLIPNAAVKVAHDYYNENGVEVNNSKGDRWRTFGDDHLNRSATTWQLASLAVLRSRSDVTETVRGTDPVNPVEAWNYTPIPPTQFEQTAFATARSLILRTSDNPLADLYIKQLPVLEHIEAFEERQKKRSQDAEERKRKVKTYLDYIRLSGKPLGMSDSDDTARDIVASPNEYGKLTLRDKAVLVQEMLNGFTGDDDEQAILTILRDVQSRGQLQDLLKIVPAKDLKSNFHGTEYQQLMQILRGQALQTQR